MRKHIDTFSQMNEGLFNDKFLVVYQITNFKTTESDEKISEWKSPVYSYIQKAKSKEEARELFESKWNELANYVPKPKLEILSVEVPREISSQIHTY